MIRHFIHLLVLLAFLSAPAIAADGPRTVIRDAEIETALKDWSGPVIRAAGLSPDAVKIILVENTDLNAFVAGGQNIFIYTGLIAKTENAGEVLGVIAHELGHIAGGHLIRTQDVAETASYEAVVGTLLGIGAAIATGSSDAAAAISGGAIGVAQRGLLAHSRVQESAADQAAARFMKEANINPTGLLTFMEKLADQDVLPTSQQSQYVRTHPLSRDRVESIRGTLEASGNIARPLPSRWADQHARMKAKLLGFIAPQQVALTYSGQDHSIAADYARAIAAYRQNRVQEALAKIDALIAREPKNPYFCELKGQMLYDFGRVSDSLAPYRTATDLAPDQALIHLSYAQALLETPGKNAARLKQAITEAERARVKEQRNPGLYRLLATAYGRQGQEGLAQAMLAEEAALQGRTKDAKGLAEDALKKLPQDVPARRRMQDLITRLDAEKEKKD